MLGKPLAAAFASMLPIKAERAFPELITELSSALRLKKTRFRVKEDLGSGERLLAGEIIPLYQSQSNFLVDVRDITEDEQAVLMDARRERLATIGNLAVGVAHEIQNPNTFSRVNASNLRALLQAIRPIVETGLQNGAAASLGKLTPDKLFTKIDEAIAGVEMASKRIESVLGTLKSFGRTPVGEDEEADPRTAITEAQLLTAHLAAGKATLKIEIGEICESEPPPEIEASPGHMILCHIPIEALRKVEPVIVQKEKATAAE
jgi:hypothetical protein